MNIDEKTIVKLANLARLEIREEDTNKFIKDMNSMLTFVEKLKELDTKNVEPLTHMSNEINRTREDVSEKGLPKKLVMQNAPKQDGDYFRVPKIIDID